MTSLPSDRHLTGVLLLLVTLLLAGIGGIWLTRPARRQAIQPQPLLQKVDINRADASVLAVLPGVGPGIAHNIVQHRQTHGPFNSLQDLRAVHMIGAVKLQQIEPYVVIGPAADTDR